MRHLASHVLRALAFLALLPGLASAQSSQWQTGLGAPGFDGLVSDALRFDDGTGPALYVCGNFTRAPGTAASSVARWNGTSWAPVGAGVTGGLAALAVFDDSTGPHLFATGVSGVTTTATCVVVRWDGTQWTNFGPSFGLAQDGVPKCLASFDDGNGARLYVGGDFPGGIVRGNGGAWQGVGGGIYNNGFDVSASVEDLVVFDDGSGFALYAGGAFSPVNQPPISGANIARFRNGVWSDVAGGLGSGWGDAVYALEIYDDGNGRKLVAGGRLVPSSGPAFNLARLENGVWVPFTSDVDGHVESLHAFDVPNSPLPQGLWVGGSFEHAGALAAHDLAVWNGSAWSAAGAGSALTSVTCLNRYDVGSGVRLFAGTRKGAGQTYDGTVWSSMAAEGGAGGMVASFAVATSTSGARELFASGDFTYVGSEVADGIAHFDGVSWHGEDLAGLVSGSILLEAIDLGAGDEVYATGRFDGYGPTWTNVIRKQSGAWSGLPRIPVAGSDRPRAMFAFDSGTGLAVHAVTRTGVYRFDGGAWTLVLAANGTAEVIDALVVDEGAGRVVYLGGYLNLLGGVACHGIARWDGTTVTNVAGGTDNFGAVWDLELYDDGTGTALFAAGSFTTMGGVACANVAKWNGTTWSPLGSGLGTIPTTNSTIAMSLAVHDDHAGFGPELVVGGLFMTADGQPVNRIARWNGTSWREPTGGIAHATQFPRINALATFDRGDGRGEALFVGGLFESAGGVPSNHVAVWESTSGDASTFCYGDGTSAACPCGNASAPGSRAGCLNSLGLGGTLRVSGHASLTHDTLVLEGGDMGNSIGLYFQGGNSILGGAGVTFGDGLRCLAGPYVRFPAQASVNGVSRYPGPTNPSVSTIGQVLVPGTHRYQIWYRDSAAFCTPSTFTYTNALEIAWGP